MSVYSFCLSKAYTRPAAGSEQEEKKRKQGEVRRRNPKNTEFTEVKVVNLELINDNKTAIEF